MSIKRTNSPHDYISPSDTDIREAAERVSLNTYSPQLVRDISNIAAGGDVIPSSMWRDELKSQVKTPEVNKDGNRYDYRNYNHYSKSAYATDCPDIAREHEEDRMVSANERVCEFIRHLDMSKIAGNSPLDKAVLTLKALVTASDCSNGSGEFDGEDLPIFSNKRADKAADHINDIFETIVSLDDIEKVLLEDEDDSQDRQGGSGHGSGMITVKMLDNMTSGARDWVNVARNLENLTRFRVSKSNVFKPDIEGDDIQKRQIAGLHEIGKISEIEYALPSVYRMLKVITGQTLIKERVSREDKQQLLYVIIDCSGSMKYGKNAINKAGGVLFNRLKAVVKEEAQMYFRFFDTKLFKEHFAGNKTQARACMKLFSDSAYNGGGTDIPSCLRDSVDRIQELLQHGEVSERPELVIVTDGEDDVKELKPIEFTRHNLRLHVFNVGRTNKNLAQLARDTGGVGVENI